MKLETNGVDSPPHVLIIIHNKANLTNVYLPVSLSQLQLLTHHTKNKSGFAHPLSAYCPNANSKTTSCAKMKNK